MVNTAFENIGIEQVREYWNSRPCNIRHSLKEIGTKEYFDQVEARKYFVELPSRDLQNFPDGKARKSWKSGAAYAQTSWILRAQGLLWPRMCLIVRLFWGALSARASQWQAGLPRLWAGCENVAIGYNFRVGLLFVASAGNNTAGLIKRLNVLRTNGWCNRQWSGHNHNTDESLEKLLLAYLLEIFDSSGDLLAKSYIKTPNRRIKQFRI